MERWAGKTAVVTGAGGDIGGAIVAALADAGLVVVGLDIKFSNNGITVKDNGSIHLRECDIRNPQELAVAFKWVEDELGGVDVMVNSAGFYSKGFITSVGGNSLSDEDIANTYDVNIKAMVLSTRRAIASMQARGVDGHVININSLAGHYVPSTVELNVYTSSKYAVSAFMSALLRELAAARSRIRLTDVSPGLVKTAMSGRCLSDFGSLPTLQPPDIAEAVLYVLSTPQHVNISQIKIQPVGEIVL